MVFEFKFKADNPITGDDLNTYEQQKGIIFPNDYRQHMLDWNGGLSNIFLHYVDEDGFDLALSNLYGLINDDMTVVTVNDMMAKLVPEGYIIIGRTRAGLDLMMCVEPGETYGEIKAMEETLEVFYVASSLTEYFDKQIIDIF